MKYIFMLIVLGALGGLMTINYLNHQKQHGEIITAIIGEAANQGLVGQIAVACGIKNRPEGLSGVDGRHMTRTPSVRETKTARLALRKAKPKTCNALIRGADMWCSDLAICNKSWKGVPMIKTKTIKDHTFFRRLTKG